MDHRHIQKNLKLQELQSTGLAKKVGSGFSVASYGKPRTNFLANPIKQEHRF